MALNIGANDVANNMGPAVGANALSMGGAIVIAAVFESAGALIAGADVVSTIAKGIVAPEALDTPATFIWAMMAALLASALWVNLATWIG
ncbi:PiT family inorganic phosphate transporter, partial [Paracoccus versutus]